MRAWTGARKQTPTPLAQHYAMDEVDVNSEDSPRYHSFSKFAESTDLQPIVDTFRYLCRDVGVDPDSCEGIYTALKRELTNWKCLDIWNLLDKRAGLPEYARQTACKGLSVLVVGAGPVGLRTAIECALLGARVDVVEKRTSFSRNNVLHLWSFVIADLVNLGAKKFYGKFCTGSINHMSKYLPKIIPTHTHTVATYYTAPMQGTYCNFSA